MPVKKRGFDEKSSSTPKSKKVKLSENDDKPLQGAKEKALPLQTTSNLISEEIDFPRGGGTSFTPLEYKVIRAEALKEADEEVVFKVRQ